MKRSWLVIWAGLLVAVAGYFGFYYAGTAKSRQLENSRAPELAWLQAEFHLSDAEFARISRMHAAYLAGCAERCRLIDEKNEHLRHLLAITNTVTPEIERTLAEAAQLRAECQARMLEQFYAVSRTMPPDQGRRYLDWVEAQTIPRSAHQSMNPSAGSPTPTHEHH